MRLVAAALSSLLPVAAFGQGVAPLSAPPLLPPRSADMALPPNGAGALGGGAWPGGAGQSAQGVAQFPGAGSPQASSGCYGCSYSGDYYASHVTARRPAPPLRLQGQWRNGWWYY